MKRCKVCKEVKDEKDFYHTVNKLSETCDLCKIIQFDKNYLYNVKNKKLNQKDKDYIYKIYNRGTVDEIDLIKILNIAEYSFRQKSLYVDRFLWCEYLLKKLYKAYKNTPLK